MSDVMVATFFQTKLMNMAESISNKLSYFNALDHLRHVSVYNSSLVWNFLNVTSKVGYEVLKCWQIILFSETQLTYCLSDKRVLCSNASQAWWVYFIYIQQCKLLSSFPINFSFSLKCIL